MFSYGDVSFDSLGESKGRVSVETDGDSADSSDIEEGDTSKVRTGIGLCPNIVVRAKKSKEALSSFLNIVSNHS